MKNRLVPSLLIILLAAGCGEAEKAVKKTACKGGLATGQFNTFVDLGETNEGLAFGPDGRMYVAANASGTIWAVTADGVKSKFAQAPAVLGLAFQGAVLYTAGFSADRVYAIDGTAHEYGGPVSKPNFVAVTPWGSLLVSNDYSADISEITGASQIAVWSRGVNSPNGMAFSADGTELFVASTFDTHPALWKIPIMESRKAGAPVRVVDFTGPSTPDGVAPVADGSMLVALNVAGRLVRVNVNDGTVTEVAKGLTFPASLAFGEGDFDPCSVYVSQLFGKGVHRVAVGALGGKLFR